MNSGNYTPPGGMFGNPLGRPKESRPASANNPHAIISVTNNGGQAVFNTGAPHGLSNGNSVDISAGVYAVASVTVSNVTSNSFQAGQAFAGNATGTWSGVGGG